MPSPQFAPPASETPAPPNWAAAFLGTARAAPLIPLAFAVAFYGEYLLAWAHLGHSPLPSLNDPKDIHPLLHWAVGIFLFICLPLASVITLVANALSPRLRLEPASRAWLRILATVALWALLISIVRSDPMGVALWWFD